MTKSNSDNLHRRIIYRETQRYNRTLCYASLLLFPFAFSISFYLVRTYFTYESNPSGFFLSLVLGVLVGILVPLFFWTHSLVIEVRDDGLFIRFLPFQKSCRRISLESLQRFGSYDSSEMSESGGWSLTGPPGKSSVTFWGSKGVELEYANGNKFFLGCKSPEEIVSAIEKCLTSIDDTVFFLKLKYIQPSQMYISKKKLESILAWFDKSEPESLTALLVRKIDNDIVLTDGHTRAYAAYMRGLDKVPVVWDREECDINEYKLALEYARAENIRTVSDCKVLDHESYEERWYNFCRMIREDLKTKRSKKVS